MVFPIPFLSRCRHSFGALSLETGIPIESIAEMMAIESTQIYTQITDIKISKDMYKLIEECENESK